MTVRDGSLAHPHPPFAGALVVVDHRAAHPAVAAPEFVLGAQPQQGLLLAAQPEDILGLVRDLQIGPGIAHFLSHAAHKGDVADEIDVEILAALQRLAVEPHLHRFAPHPAQHPAEADPLLRRTRAHLDKILAGFDQIALLLAGVDFGNRVPQRPVARMLGIERRLIRKDQVPLEIQQADVILVDQPVGWTVGVLAAHVQTHDLQVRLAALGRFGFAARDLLEDLHIQRVFVELASRLKARAADAIHVLPRQVPGWKVRPGVPGLEQLELHRLLVAVAQLLPAPGAVDHRQGVAILDRPPQNDVPQLGDQGVVVVRVEPVPGALLQPAARLAPVGQIRPGNPLPGQVLGIVVGVEVVDVHLQGRRIDVVLLADMGPLDHLAEVG